MKSHFLLDRLKVLFKQINEFNYERFSLDFNTFNYYFRTEYCFLTMRIFKIKDD